MSDNLPAVIDNMLVMPDNSNSFEYKGVVYTVENNKLYNPDHEVAVVWSPGGGADWSATYDTVDPTDAKIAFLTLTGLAAMVMIRRWEWEVPVRIEGRKFYMFDWPLGDDLEIEWIPAGGLFKITEDEGHESIEFPDDINWRVA